jgi:single-stranded-DNA-specific exonuclease
MYRFLAISASSRIYIPDRIFEGYGPNPAAINQLIDNGAG